MLLAALYRRALLCLVHGTAAHCTVKINEVTVEYESEEVSDA